MSQLQLMRIKKKLKSQFQEYLPGEMYLLSEQMKVMFDKKLMDSGLDKVVEFVNLDELIKPLDLQHDDPAKVIVIRSGGIGDLIALSTVCETIGSRIHFLTQNRYLPVFDWYRDSSNIKGFDYTKPVFRDITYSKLLQLSRTTRYAKFDDTIENGSTENWFHVFYRNIGAEIKPELCRPILVSKKYLDSSNIAQNKPSVLICHRASANMRSISFRAIYRALLKLPLKKACDLYVHEGNLTNDDFDYINLVGDESIKVIKANTTTEYLNDLYAATLTISVDTAAIHFREGVQKPAIGIYSSFTAECRTKYYRFTKSFNVTSPCEHQPCFIHQTEMDQVCTKAEKGSLVAPCLDLNFNTSLLEQLRTNIEKALNELKINF